MENITYISNGRAIEYTLPDGYSSDCVSIIPNGAQGVIALVKGIDYQVLQGVIRFTKALPAGTTITIAESSSSLDIPASPPTQELQALSEAYINNSATIAEAFDRIRNLEQQS